MKKIFLLVIIALILPKLNAQTLSAKDILEKSSNACINLTSIQYSINQISKKDNVPNIKATILQQKTEISNSAGFDKAYIKVDGNKNDKSHFEYAFNGDQLQYSNSRNKDLITLNSPTQMSSMQTIGYDLLLLRIFPFTNYNGFPKNFDSVELKSKNQIIDNHVCYQLDLSRKDRRSGNNIITTWWISQKDFLPRALQTSLYKKEIYISEINKKYPKSLFTINKTNNKNTKIITSKEVEDNYAKEGLFPKGTKLRDWSLIDSYGKQRKLSDFKNQIKVIDFWGTWCMPCIKVMPDIQKIHEDYKNANVVVMGLAVNDKPGRPEKFFRKKGFNYMLFPKADKVNDLYKVKVYPTIYVLNKKGEVIYAHRGLKKNLYNDLKKVIDKELK